MTVAIRPARESDLERINEIYDTTIVDSHVSFDDEPWCMNRRRAWWEMYDEAGPYRVFVAEADDQLVGASYSSPYKDKAGYRTSVETTTVLDPAYTGRGIGRQLLSSLLDDLTDAGVHRAYAIVALPNEPSIRAHEALGYRVVGTLDEVGFKLGRYWDTTILEKRLDGPEA
ncbi:MAG: N-acetyltransferase family protein [Actinomycetota bacterium]